MERPERRRGATGGLLRRLLPVAALVALLAAFFALGLDRYVTFDMLKANRAALQEFVDRNLLLAALAYVAGYTLIAAASLPVAAVVTLAGGFLFGAVLGTVLTVAGATMGATAVFLVARSAFGDALRIRARPYLGRMEDGFRRNQVCYMLFLRLMPVFPFFVVNIAPAFLGVGTRIYVVTTILGIIPATAVISIVGAGLGAIFDRGGTLSLATVLSPEILIGLAGLALLALAPVLFSRLKRGPPDASR